jgi:Ca-activated chloride channel family protein
VNFTLEVQNPIVLNGLWVVALLVAIGSIALVRAQRRLRRFADPALLRTLSVGASPRRAWLRLLLGGAALALVVVAASDVRWGVVTVEARRRGLDVMFVLDLSRSMLATDARPDRLSRAKQLIADVVERLPEDRVGLIGFAGDAAVTCPLTLNHDAFRIALEETDIRDAGRGGSMLGDAIRAAGECFTDPSPEGKLIVVISDGEDHGSEPLDAAAVVRRERGARVFTVGLGDEREGGRIPVSGSGRSGYLTHEGQEGDHEDGCQVARRHRDRRRRGVRAHRHHQRRCRTDPSAPARRQRTAGGRRDAGPPSRASLSMVRGSGAASAGGRHAGRRRSTQQRPSDSR